MKAFQIASSMLVVSLAISAPTLVVAHVGHGDEFQATGGVQRVKVNAETDQMLGIIVTPIEQAAPSGTGVLIPVTALVDADGKQLVFVQYKNFYEPVEVTTGGTQGELVEVTQGLSAGEKLVTQGSLSLYAESRKTQTAETAPAAPSSDTFASPQSANSHAQADAQGIPHSHDAAGDMAQQPSGQKPSGDTTESRGFPFGWVAAGVCGAVLFVGAGAIALFSPRKKKNLFSNRKGDI